MTERNSCIYDTPHKIKHEAASWILLLESNDKFTAKQTKELNAWVNKSSYHKELLGQLAKTWGELDLLAPLLVDKKINDYHAKLNSNKSIVTRIKDRLFGESTSTLKRSPQTTGWALFLSITVLSSIYMIGYDINKNKYSTYSSAIGQTTQVTLADGSDIWLNSNSQIKVNYNTEKRKVNLLFGEAYFKVVKNIDKPFEVYVGDKLVRAVGTEFSVYKKARDIEVIVSEGVVEFGVTQNVITHIFKNDVSSNTGNHSDIITLLNTEKIMGRLNAGESIDISLKNASLSQKRKLAPEMVEKQMSWRKNYLIFEREKLAHVISEISRHTHLKFEILDDNLNDRVISGKFKIGNTDDFLYLIENGLGIKVKVIGDKNIILYQGS